MRSPPYGTQCTVAVLQCTSLHPYRVKGIEFSFFVHCKNFSPQWAFCSSIMQLLLYEDISEEIANEALRLIKVMHSADMQKRGNEQRKFSSEITILRGIPLERLLCTYYYPFSATCFKSLKNQRKNWTLKFWCSISEEMEIFSFGKLNTLIPINENELLNKLNGFHSRITRGNQCCEMSHAFEPSSMGQEIYIKMKSMKKARPICKKYK